MTARLSLRKKSLLAASAATAVVLALVPAAFAHVTANVSGTAAPGAFVKIAIRAPSERDVPTTELTVSLPDGINDVSVQPVPGWTYTKKTEKLATPIKMDDGDEVTERVSEITWTGGKILPGEFQEFPISVQLPMKGEVGGKIFFPALQTYQGGEVVKWIEKPSSASDDPFALEKPAPFVDLSAGGASSSTAVVKLNKDTTAELDSRYATHKHVHSELNKVRAIGIVGLALAVIALLVGITARSRNKKD